MTTKNIRNPALWLSLFASSFACDPSHEGAQDSTENRSTETTSSPATAKQSRGGVVFDSPPSSIAVSIDPLSAGGQLPYEPVASAAIDNQRYVLNGHARIENNRSTSIDLDRAIFRLSPGPNFDWNQSELIDDVLGDGSLKARLMGGGWNRVGHQTELDGNDYETFHDIVDEGNEYFAVGVQRRGKDRFRVVKYNYEGERDIEVTTFGSWNQARAFGVTHHGSSVVVVGGVESSAAHFAAARFNERLELDTSFGGDGRVRFGMPGCGGEELVDVVRYSGSYYAVGRATCDGRQQGAVVKLDSSGNLVNAFNADGQAKLSFFSSDVEATGVAVRGSWVYVSGHIGSSCDPFQNGSGTCLAFVTRFNRTTGQPDNNYGNYGSYNILSTASGQRQGASAVAVDSSGRATVVGWTKSTSTNESWITAARFTSSGQFDMNFQGQSGGISCTTCAGPISFKLSGYDAVGRDLVLRSDGTIAIAASVQTPASGQDFALAILSSSGALQTQRSAFHENGGNFQYNIPSGITEDDSGRLVMAGRSNIFLSFNSNRAATAGFLADGKLARRTSLAPGDRRTLFFHLPYLDAPAPGAVELELRFSGLLPHVTNVNTIQHRNGPVGSYPFAARQEDLPADTYWVAGNEHTLGHPHVWNPGQRYAIDFGAWRYSGTGWTSRTPSAESKDAEDLVNSDFMIWNTPVYTMDGGYIRECYRTVPENTYGEDAVQGGGGNMFYIDHDSGETVLYAHLRNGSVPSSLCPNEGVLPGPTYPRIEAGTRLGRVGNTGSSSGPHLHVDAQQSYETNSGLPILYRDIDVHHQTWPLTQWTEATERAVTRPSAEGELLIRPRLLNASPVCDSTGRINGGPDHGELCGTVAGGPCADIQAGSYKQQWLYGVSDPSNDRFHPNGDASFHTRCDFDADTGLQMVCNERNGTARCEICGHGPAGDNYTELGCRPTGTCPTGTQLWPDGRCWDLQDGLPNWMCEADCETMYNGHGWCLNGLNWRMTAQDLSPVLSAYPWQNAGYNYADPMCASWDCDGDGAACASAGLACDPDPGTCIDECWSNSDCSASNPPPAYPSPFICTNLRTCQL